MDTNNTTVRFLLVGALALALLLPLLLITDLAYERETYYAEARATVIEGWGQAQVVTAPMLRVPVKPGDAVWQLSEAEGIRTFAASAARHDVKLEHTLRSRGIFDVPVYTAEMSVSTEFAPDRDDTLDWQNAELIVGLADSFGLTEAELNVNGEALTWQPFSSKETADDGSGLGGLSARVDASEPLQVEARFSVRGAASLRLVPTALQADTTLSGTWPHPSFRGRFLPAEAAVDAGGFESTWRYLPLSGLPASWQGDGPPDAFNDRAAVVALNEPVGIYRMVQRSAKYGVLFLAVTYLTLICFELTSGWRFHLVQYVSTGAAILVFFLALLALAEHLPFVLAYVTASTVVCGLITWYVHRMTALRRLTLTAGGVLVSAYTALYVLLLLEAYALLAGTLLLLLGIGALMWSTQRLAEPPPIPGVE